MNSITSYLTEDIFISQPGIFDHMSDMVLLTDLHGNLLYVNTAASDSLAAQNIELVGKNFGQFYSTNEGMEISYTDFLEKSKSVSGFDGELTLRDSEGQFYPCHIKTTLVKDLEHQPKYILIILRGPARSDTAEDTSMFIEDKYQQYVQNAPIGIFIIDKAGNYIEVNETASRITGYSKEELVTMSLYELRVPDDQYSYAFDQLVTEGKVSVIKEFVRKDGSRGWWSIESVQLSDDRFMAMITDVTEMKHLEDKLIESEARLNRAQKVARIGSWSIDINTRQVQATAQARELYGLHQQNLTVDEIQEIPLAEYRPILDKALYDLIKNDEPYDVEFKIQRQIDGEVFDIHSVAVYDANRQMVFGTIQDVTQRKKLEDKRSELQRQVQHIQKLESLGLMAGGIAHDFNNLLMAMMGNMRLSLSHLPTSSDAVPGLQAALKAAERASDLTLQMLSYAGRAQVNIHPLNLNHLIQDNLTIFKAGIDRSVDIQLNLDTAIPDIPADKGQIQQVIMNLITNATEALSDKDGIIRISTGIHHMKSGESRHILMDQLASDEEYIYLEVQDNGVGMSTETIERLFDPFFTTKFTGRGLGMSAVKGIIEGHNGTIFLDSAPGEGTTIRTVFPVKREHGDEIQSISFEEPVYHEPDLGAIIPGKILVVDDEEMVLDVSIKMLETIGIEVIGALGGEEAIALFNEDFRNISGVIIDYSMPGMDGVQLLKIVPEQHPEKKYILSSGYTENAADRLQVKGLAGFLHKPYDYKNLIKLLYQIFKTE